MKNDATPKYEKLYKCNDKMRMIYLLKDIGPRSPMKVSVVGKNTVFIVCASCVTLLTNNC